MKKNMYFCTLRNYITKYMKDIIQPLLDFIGGFAKTDFAKLSIISLFSLNIYQYYEKNKQIERSEKIVSELNLLYLQREKTLQNNIDTIQKRLYDAELRQQKSLEKLQENTLFFYGKLLKSK